MFFDKSKFLGALKKTQPQRDSLLEYSFGELSALSDPARRGRSKTITTFFKGLEQSPDGQARTLWEVPSQSKSGVKYRVTVGIDVPQIGLFGVAKQKWDAGKITSLIKNAEVRVHCTCPDFYWAGPKYNLGPSGFLRGSVVPNMNAGHKGSGYSEQTAVTEPPDITDPNREHVLCKHAIAVSTNFAANAFSIMKAARNFAVKIKVNDNLKKETDSGKAPLKKDVDFVDLNTDESKKITEAILHGAQQVSEEESTLQKDQGVPAEVSEEPKVEPSVPELSGGEEVPVGTEKPVEDLGVVEPVTEPIVEPRVVVPEKSSGEAQSAGVPPKLQKDEESAEPQKMDSELNAVPPEDASETEVQIEKAKASPNEILGKHPENPDQEPGIKKPQ